MCFKGSWRKIGSTQLWRLSPLREKCALTKQPLSNVEQLWANLNTSRSVLANIHSEISIVGSNIFIAGKSDLTNFLAISHHFLKKIYLWQKNLWCYVLHLVFFCRTINLCQNLDVKSRAPAAKIDRWRAARPLLRQRQIVSQSKSFFTCLTVQLLAKESLQM